MIIGIFTKDGRPVANQTDLRVVIKRQYIYGLPLEYHIGIKDPSIVFKLRKKYKFVIPSFNSESVELLLYSEYKDVIGEDIIQFYRFIHPDFEKLLDNTIPNNLSLFGVSFKDYIKELNNQYEYFIFGLRKKGLFMALNENGRPMQKHTFNVLFGKPKQIKDQAYSINKIANYSLKTPNYYTILESGEVIRTKNGINIPQYLPFATKEDIIGLDTYITPKYELKAPVINLNIGDMIEIEKDKCIIMEKEVFRYKTNEQTLLVAGVKV